MRCTAAFLGDVASSIEVVPGVSRGGRVAELRDGDPLPLSTPPQGGHVALVAVLARNVDPCRARLTARLRSLTTGEVAAEDVRDVALGALTDGWATPDLSDISNVANVPLCPDYHAESIVDVRHTLEVRLEDSRGAALAGTVARAVVPTCEQTGTYEQAQCRCECSANYTLGSCADPLADGGHGR